MVIDEYGQEIILDKKTKRSLSPAMKTKIAAGKYISRKKGPKLTMAEKQKLEDQRLDNERRKLIEEKQRLEDEAKEKRHEEYRLMRKA